MDENEFQEKCTVLDKQQNVKKEASNGGVPKSGPNNVEVVGKSFRGTFIQSNCICFCI